MRLWTVQPIEVLKAIQREGFARVDPSKTPTRWFVPSSYRWLIWQMGERLVLPDEYHGNDDSHRKGIFPWFAYCERPDLRWVRHSQMGKQTLIEFSPPLDRFLSFPCWAWGDIFCGFFLAYTRQEYSDWNSKFRESHGCGYRDWEASVLPQPFQSERDASWLRLFDPAIPKRSWRRGGTTKHEAVNDILDESWIKKVTLFEGCRR